MENREPFREVDLGSHQESRDRYPGKLLVPGWAGELDRKELAYIKSRLRESLPLSRWWGFRPSAKRLSTTRIRRVAMDGLHSDGGAVSASPGKHTGHGMMKNTSTTKNAKTSATKSGHPHASKRKLCPDPGPFVRQNSEGSSNNTNYWAR